MAPKTKHEWAKVDPAIDRLKDQGWNDTQIARDLGISRQTLIDHLRRRGSPGVPSQTPKRVPTRTPAQVPMGANRGSVEGTVIDEEVNFPVADDLQHQTLERLAEAVLPLVLAGIEAWLETRVPQRVPIGVSRPEEMIPVRRYPAGTPGYPNDPRRDSRLNLHLRAGERWEVHAVAEALHTTPSALIRQLWADFMASPHGHDALQRSLAKMGTHLGTSEGSP